MIVTGGPMVYNVNNDSDENEDDSTLPCYNDLDDHNDDDDDDGDDLSLIIIMIMILFMILMMITTMMMNWVQYLEPFPVIISKTIVVHAIGPL